MRIVWSLALLLLLATPAWAAEKCVVRTLTAVELETMDYTSRPVIVAAQGVGKAIAPTSVQWLVGSGTDWTWDPAYAVPVLVLESEDDTTFSLGDRPTEGLGGTSWLASGFIPATDSIALTDNSPLYVAYQATRMTGGTRSLKVRVCYVVMSVAF